MPDKDNGNGKVKNAVQDEKIDRIQEDITEIKDTLKTFIDSTTDVRLHCSNEFGVINTNIKIIWGFLTTVFSGLVAVVVKILFFAKNG